MFISPSRVPVAGLNCRKSCQFSSNQPLLQSVLDGVPVGLLCYDKHQNVVLANDCITTILEVNPQILARSFRLSTLLENSAVLSSDGVEVAHEACLAATTAAPGLRLQTSIEGLNGRSFTLDICRIEDDHFMILFEEVTDHRAAEASALERALHDPLTDLPNRQLFERRICALLAECAAPRCCASCRRSIGILRVLHR